jgi:hypothetical protein
MINAKMLLPQQGVDQQNVCVDYLQRSIAKKKKQQKKQKGILDELENEIDVGVFLLRC